MERRRNIAVSIASVLILALAIMLLSGKAFAAGSIAVNTRSLTLYQGETGQIKIKADNTAGRIDWTSSGSVSASGSMWIENEIKTINVYADSPGSGTVTLTLSDAATFDQAELRGNYVVTVTVLSSRTLYNGMSGEDVLSLQTRLSQLGYPVGDLDGVFGGMTEAAVRAFQTDRGLAVDGVAGPQTLAALGTTTSSQASSDSGRALSIGMTGDDVLELQMALADLGYGVGDLDGIFGSMTEAAVRAFQIDRGLYVDGVAGPQTLGVLLGGTASGSASGSSSQSAASGETRALSNGMTGDDVYRLQAVLSNLGYAVGDLDGIFGSMTEAAVYAFQSDRGLYVDGVAGPQTQGALGLSGTSGSSASGSGTVSFNRAMSYGMNGTDIAVLQQTLAQLGYAVGPADGVFGSLTQAAVIAYQSDHGLATDGVAGPLTQAALGLR